jgi:NADPH:quinone reductase-like Zn-dependent oxidoreductase
MRAYQLPKGGSGIDALVKVERPDPKPAYRQVVVKVKACSLNFRDLGIVRGTYRMPVRENLIPLSDGAGEVIEVGPGVTRVKVGDRVAGCFFQRWAGGEAPADVHASALGGGIDGMLAERDRKTPWALVAGGGGTTESPKEKSPYRGVASAARTSKLV